MKNNKNYTALALASVLSITGCMTTGSSAPPKPSEQATASSSDPADLVVCEQIVRADLAEENGDLALYSPEFRQAIAQGYKTVDEFDISILNHDIRYLTTDGKPAIKSVGPAFHTENKVKVPVKMQWDSDPPYTNTWVLVQSGSTWLITDLFTSGHGYNNGSLRNWLANNLKTP